MADTIDIGRAGRTLGVCRELVPCMTEDEANALWRVLLAVVERLEREGA